MPEVNVSVPADKLRAALDAQGRSAEAARKAAAEAARKPDVPAETPPAQDRKP